MYEEVAIEFVQELQNGMDRANEFYLSVVEDMAAELQVRVDTDDSRGVTEARPQP